MNRLAFDLFSEFRPQSFLRYQIHRAAEQVFEIERQIHELIEAGFSAEFDQNIHIAARRIFIACDRSKHGNVADLKSALEIALAMIQ